MFYRFNTTTKKLGVYATYEEAHDTGNPQPVFHDEQSLASAGLSLGDMAGIYNAHSDKPVARFADRNKAVTRTWAALAADYAGEERTAPADAVNDEPQESSLKQGNRKVGRPMGTGKFAGKRVFAKCKKNPRRNGVKGWHSYEIILGKEHGVPYDDYVAKGGRVKDLQWDIDRGWAEVK